LTKYIQLRLEHKGLLFDSGMSLSFLFTQLPRKKEEVVLGN